MTRTWWAASIVASVLGCGAAAVPSARPVAVAGEPALNRSAEVITLRLAPAVGTRWTLIGRTLFDLGTGPIEGTMTCTTQVTAASGTFVELATTGCAVGADENASVAPPAMLGDVVERYDSLGRSMAATDEPHVRRGYPVLLTFPERPVGVGDRWAAPPATVAGMSAELLPATLDHELTELEDGRATLAARGEVVNGLVRLQLTITGVVDVATGTYLSYAMDLRASAASAGNGPAFHVAFDFTTSPSR